MSYKHRYYNKGSFEVELMLYEADDDGIIDREGPDRVTLSIPAEWVYEGETLDKEGQLREALAWAIDNEYPTKIYKIIETRSPKDEVILKGWQEFDEDVFEKGGQLAMAKAMRGVAQRGESKISAERQQIKQMRGFQAEARKTIDNYKKGIKDTEKSIKTYDKAIRDNKKDMLETYNEVEKAKKEAVKYDEGGEIDGDYFVIGYKTEEDADNSNQEDLGHFNNREEAIRIAEKYKNEYHLIDIDEENEDGDYEVTYYTMDGESFEYAKGGRVRTNSKEVREKVRQHILDSVYDENEEEFDTFGKASKYLVKEFKRVADYPYNLKRIPNNQERFEDYLRGIPFHFEFENYKIEEFLNSLGINSENKEYDSDKMWRLYGYLIWREVEDDYYDRFAKGGMLEIDTIYDNGGESADRYTLIDEDGDMYGIGGREVNMYLGNRSEFPSDLSYLGKKVEYEDLSDEVKKEIDKRLDTSNFAKGGKVEKKQNNEMLIGGIAGILLGIFLNR